MQNTNLLNNLIQKTIIPEHKKSNSKCLKLSLITILLLILQVLRMAFKILMIFLTIFYSSSQGKNNAGVPILKGSLTQGFTRNNRKRKVKKGRREIKRARKIKQSLNLILITLMTTRKKKKIKESLQMSIANQQRKTNKSHKSSNFIISRKKK